MDELRVVLPEGVEGILAAVSGGADSMALLAMLREAVKGTRVRLTAAHFEHGIRGEASRQDAAFVRQVCLKWGVPLLEGGADVPALAQARSVGLEEAARDARYAFLRRAKEECGAQLIALAHHQDDQAETVLMHLFRGSGLHGAGGMKRMEGDLFRPLLDIPKKALTGFLLDRNIPWREDDTNRIADTPRNGLRLEVFPRIERYYPAAGRALARFADLAGRDDDFLRGETERFLSANSARFPGGCLIRLAAGSMPHPAIFLRGVHAMCLCGAEGAHRVLGLCDERPGVSCVLEGGWRAERGRLGVYLLKDCEPPLPGLPLPVEGSFSLSGLGWLCVERGTGMPIRDDPFRQELDAASLSGAVVRTRRPGDIIFPLGAPGRQKLSDYLINRHIDRPVRELLPIVARDGEVLWVMGVGISECVKLRGGEAVRLTLSGWPLQKFGGTGDA